MLQAELKILGGKHQGKLIPLNVKKFLVGREQDCHLRPNSDLVSRHHCVFSIDDYAVRLRDLGSTNGTLVNGNSLRGEVILKAGDRVTIGKLELEVNIRQGAAKTPPPPVAKDSTEDAVPNSSPVVSTAEIPTVPVEGDSSYELASVTGDAGTTQQIAAVPADTAIIGTFPGAYPQQNPMGYPQAYPPMMPQGYPMMGGYMPQQYPQYPPGYGQPMGYPMGQMGYPQMMPQQQGYPGAAVAAPAVAEPSSPTPATEMAVKLPDPAETGVKPAAPPAPAAAGTGPAKKEEKPSTTAADIIKQYMSKRS